MTHADTRQHPGSRWWKFDFHTHTPASHDTHWHVNNHPLTPEEWLQKYMDAKVDCIAITDHNSGKWIDKLKSSYVSMKSAAASNFRELTIFPGVEISVHGGVHILAILDPTKAAGDIDTLLGQVEYQGTKGDSDGVTKKGIADVIRTIIEVGAIPIPAHADNTKGLLQCQGHSRKTQLDANTVKQAIEVQGLLAVEWCDLTKSWPECVSNLASSFARVLGSDCHSFQGNAVPGSRFTWIKMARPTIEGLRLALLDGNEVSIRRSDEAFDPLRIPMHCIASIEIENARYMGNGTVARLELSPYFNAIVGGRGTGKSSAVHALRIATQRNSELEKLGSEAEPNVRFADFKKIWKNRDDKGALRESTNIRVEWLIDNRRYRLNWRNSRTRIEENENGSWLESSSQSLTSARFPVRIFSQGQIAAMAGSGQSMLSVIDDAANVESIRQSFNEARREFFSQRARLRELDGKLSGRPELERKRDDAKKKLETLSASSNAAILKAYAIAQTQQRSLNAMFQELRSQAENVKKTAQSLTVGVWEKQIFDSETIAWRNGADQLIEQIREGLFEQVEKFLTGIDILESDPRLAQLHRMMQSADADHAALQNTLRANGVTDPNAFARLTNESQEIDTQLAVLSSLQIEKDGLAGQIEIQFLKILETRKSITARRHQFIEQALANNEHVRITVVPFGFDERTIEREFRELIDVPDERFAESILRSANGEASEGIASDLAKAPAGQKEQIIDEIKRRLITPDADRGGHFANHLRRKHEKAEFSDHIRTWFPEDDLEIKYKRENAWYPISQGSQGQRSAALLAFLLSFGEEPVILDQPEDDLDNHLIYDLIVRQIRENKLRRQLIVVTHNANLVVNGDAELIHIMSFGGGQCFVNQSGSFQDEVVRKAVCRVMEGGEVAFTRRWKRLGKSV